MFLISTPQRCGSTWLTKSLSQATNSHELYVNGWELGFSLTDPSEPDAVPKLAAAFAARPDVEVFKTHDVPTRDFAAVCAAVPGLRILTVHRDFRDTIVSRYFMFRYYWPTDPSLGPVPEEAREFLARNTDTDDHTALADLIETGLLRKWAWEWAAFEGPLATDRALRVTYDGMLDGSEFARVKKFTGLRRLKPRSFKGDQRQETRATGRQGNARFNRSGRSGEWREWFTPEQGARLMEITDEFRR